MKKTLAILALALFVGGISVPAIAAVNQNLEAIVLQEDDPKKKEKKSEKKSDCAKDEKASKSTAGEKKSDSSKSCGGVS